MNENMNNNMGMNNGMGMNNPMDANAMNNGMGINNPMDANAMNNGMGMNNPMDANAMNNGMGMNNPMDVNAMNNGMGMNNPMDVNAMNNGMGMSNPMNNDNGTTNFVSEDSYGNNQNFENNDEIDMATEDIAKKSGKKKAIIICLVLAVVVIAVVAFLLLGGGSNNNPDGNSTIQTTEQPPEKTEEPIVEATVDPESGEIPEGMTRSRLTGEIISEELAAKRPYAVMLSNIKAATPQSGISEADILFECVVEGGITRCMGIFQEINVDKLGSIRSARPYYVSFAKDFDAIYFHVGGSDDAKAKIKSLGIADIDEDTTSMFRDKSISAPHNCFTSADKVKKAVANKGFRTDYQGKDNNYFTFNSEEVAPEGVDAGKVTIKFSSYTTPYFTYNTEDSLYYRYQYGSAHKDKNTGEQLSFKNLVLMYVKQWSYDEADRQEMDIYDSTGKGKYISNGKAIDITWKRNEKSSTMQFLDESGNLLSVNVGNTYIGVVPNTMQSATSITAQ